MLEIVGANVGAIDKVEKVEVVVLMGTEVVIGVIGVVLVGGGETGVKVTEGPVGVGDGIASVLHTTVFCAPIIKFLEPDTLLALPLTVLLFPSKLLVFPLTVLLEPFIAL